MGEVTPPQPGDSAGHLAGDEDGRRHGGSRDGGDRGALLLATHRATDPNNVVAMPFQCIVDKR